MENPTPADLQRNLFKRLLTQSTVADLCQLLSVNQSSVYARIKGDKLLNFAELLLLSQSFAFSLDDFFFSAKERVRFQLDSLHQPVRSGREYLQRVTLIFKHFTTATDLRLWFSTNELLFFHHLHFRELALFKLFAYARINWQLPYTESLIFEPDSFPEREVYELLMKPILEGYTRLPTLEFWSDEIYGSTLRQIRYFTRSGQVSNRTADILMEQLETLCALQYDMARQGEKWAYGPQHRYTSGPCGRLELYHNEIAYTNITFLAESQGNHGVFVVFDDPNFMFVDDEPLYAYTMHWMSRLRTKCVRISEEAEQQRRAFFGRLQQRIQLEAY